MSQSTTALTMVTGFPHQVGFFVDRNAGRPNCRESWETIVQIKNPTWNSMLLVVLFYNERVFKRRKTFSRDQSNSVCWKWVTNTWIRKATIKHIKARQTACETLVKYHGIFILMKSMSVFDHIKSVKRLCKIQTLDTTKNKDQARLRGKPDRCNLRQRTRKRRHWAA